jgi:hypothetical protein
MTTDRRREPRIESSLSVLVWGIDARGLPFTQTAVARNISGQGALLAGVDRPVRCGDIVVVQYGKRRAHFRVIWTRDSGTAEKIRAAVQKFPQEECPWIEELPPATSTNRANLHPGPGASHETGGVTPA